MKGQGRKRGIVATDKAKHEIVLGHGKKSGIVYCTKSKPNNRENELDDKEKALTERERQLEEKARLIAANKYLIDDTIHEIRKINNQINKNVSDLSKGIDDIVIYDDNNDRFIRNTLKTLDANSSLLSIRMDAYDILFNPASMGNELDVMMGVYAKVEKIYKCLYPSKKEKNLSINLIGGSEKKFRLRNSMELAFFIIIENAIKYSPINQNIDIKFTDNREGLEVQFVNWAICPKDDEMNRLTERGYRSQNINGKQQYKGSGLGLYLLKQICEANNVEFNLDKENKVYHYTGVTYNPFVVTLSFKG